MTERHLIAYAILLLVVAAALLLWRRARRARRTNQPHLRIDLLGGGPEEPLETKS